MIFDSHFHLLPEEIYKNASFYNESWGGLEGHLLRLDEAGVGRALISNPTTDFHLKQGMTEIEASRVYNAAVSKITGESYGRLAWLAAIPLTEPVGMAAEMQNAKREGASGLTMPTNGGGIYPDDQKFLPFFEKAEAAGMPVFFHPTTLTPFGHKELRHPLITPVFQYSFDTAICMAKVIDCGLLKMFPRLKLVFASFGGVMPFLAGRFDRTYNMLLGRGIVKDMGEEPGSALKKMYVDTSGVTSASLLRLAIEVFGEDHLLWGSDFPANRDITGSIHAVRDLKLGCSCGSRILGANLESLLV